jgi:DNA repair protein SbcC/Rad50
MRPARLELEGFTSFRERTVVDFGGVELFALAGPTGAGKSSVIDAMIFALYGTVPRLSDERQVAPVVSQGRTEARVRLDFDVGGERWTAVRVVRLRDGRATTKEARLEHAGQVVAGNARELDVEVSALLGLTAQQFTTCVVLPQGQFARFLQAKPADRQDLLVRLLELGLFDAVREAAGQVAGRLEGERTELTSHLTALAAATPEAVAEEQARCDRLDALVCTIEDRLPALAAAEQRREDSRAALARQGELLRLLAVVRPPADVPDLAGGVEEARSRVAAVEAAEARAMVALDSARRDRAAAGDRAPLERWQRAHEEAPAVESRAKKAAAELEAARRQGSAALAAQEAAARGAEAMAAAYDALVAEHRAAALRGVLVVGEPCPVCDQPVSAIPHHDEPAELAKARAARERASGEAAAAARGAREVEVAVARADERAARAEADRVAHEAVLEGAPSADEVAAALARIVAADRGVAAADAARDRAAAERQKAARQLAAAADAEREGWAVFDSVRDRIVELAPPPADRTTLAGAWQELMAWSAARRADLEADLPGLEAQAAAFDDECAKRAAELDGTLVDAGLDRDGRPHRDVAVEARAQSAQLVAALREAAEEHRRLTERDADLGRRVRVATALKQELHANRFEKWVLDHVLNDLCVAASTLLHELSERAYSLAVDDRGSFVVIDHRNADEARLARTLSGGETFLASLALALALAEQVARSGRGARLESLFLDEGFGTLDAATLDVVAGAMEDLGSKGRMVGLVSHVPELAERVPVRFEVRRQPRSSTIERVDQ